MLGTSWNCITGCTKVSTGCRFCSIEREWPRLAGIERGVYHGRSFGDVACHPERLEQPLRWVKPRMVSVDSHSDLFHEAIPDEFIDQMFAVMLLASQHTYQILTKREDRMLSYLSDSGRKQKIFYRLRMLLSAGGSDFNGYVYAADDIPWPLPNAWIGVSVEDQVAADRRIPVLLQVPAAVRWVSCEPLLGPIELKLSQCGNVSERAGGRNVLVERRQALDWVVVGCESGPQRRKLDIDWVRSLRAQCNAAEMPFLIKQMYIGGKLVENPSVDGSSWAQYPKTYKAGLALSA